jgi:hypothetical protein
MRYLDSRDNYLKKVSERKIQKQEEIENYQYKKIFENTTGSGALGNEIPWGDSLLGRLINSTLRKVQEGINTMKMSRLVDRLKAHFEYMVGQSVVAKLSDEDKEQIDVYNIEICIRALQQSVDRGDKIGEIKRICDETISGIEKIELSNEENKSNKENILEILKEFREWLNQFKDDEGENDPEKEDEGEGEEDGEGEGSDGSLYSLYPTMVKALKSLSLVLTYYKKVQIQSAGKEEQSGKKSLKYVCKGGETIESIQKDFNINKFKLTTDQIWSINSKVLQPYVEKATKVKTDKNKLQLSKGLVLTLEMIKESNQFLFENKPIAGSNAVGSSKPIGSGAGVKRAEVSGGESHLIQAFNKLKKSCEILESQSEKGVGITSKFLDEITSSTLVPKKEVTAKAKKEITSLFIEINRFLVGDKKATLNASGNKLYESLEILEDKQLIISEKIARFTVRALQFDGENLYGGLGDLGKPLKQYVDCIKLLNKAGVPKVKKEEKVEDKKKESQNEKTLFRYQDFYKRITEAQEDEGDTKSVSEQVKKYFYENFDSLLDGLDLSEEKKKELEKKVDDLEGKSTIVINGTSPILEVMRLFNRAYKIHTKNAIPFSGRTDGKLNVMTMNQWTAFGNTSGEIKGKGEGPYRNNKLFNQWEDAVYDVMKKYELVFTKDTVLKVGDFTKKEAGTALRQLIMDLLDGDDLYKSGEGGFRGGDEGGAQKRALNKYFDDVPGLEPDKVKPEQLSVATPDGNDLQEIEPIANEIKESDICFVKIDRLSDFPNRASNLEGAFFTFNTSDVKETRYGFIQSVDNEFVYISYTKNWYWFQKYLDGQNGKPCKIKQKDAPINKNTDLSIGVFGTKISTGQFFNVLKPGIVKLNGLSAVKDAKPENKYQKVNLDVNNVVWLSTETEKDKSYELKKLSDFAKLRGTIDTIRNSGFTKIKETIKDGGTKDNPLLTGK